ncbi:retrovirus-related pol polyprotein from transposon TNT 1-94 [Tanacetum coccineum]
MCRSDTRPPMLDRTDFASWQQRIRLYCREWQFDLNFVNNCLPEWGNLITTVKLTEGYEALRLMISFGYGGAQNRVGNANPGQARQIKCYNYNGIGHIARNCTQPKHP